MPTLLVAATAAVPVVATAATLLSRCHHSSRVAATADTLPPSPRHYHHSCDAAVALLPQQPRHYHSSCDAAVALLPQQQRCRHSSRVIAVVSLPQQCVAATARCHRCVTHQPHHRRSVAATAAMTLMLRPRRSVAATAVPLPLRRHIVVHRHHSSHVAATGGSLPQQLQCCRCIFATAAASPG